MVHVYKPYHKRIAIYAYPTASYIYMCASPFSLDLTDKSIKRRFFAAGFMKMKKNFLECTTQWI